MSDKQGCGQGTYTGRLRRDLRTVVMVERRVEVDEEVSEETAFYISSAPADAKKHYACIRNHWAIENKLHWTLDVTFDEDRSRARATKNAAENLNTVRHITLNLIKKNKEPKMTIKGARMKAGWTSSYIIDLICGTINSPTPEK